MKRRKEIRSFVYQYRSCTFCCSVDGLAVSDTQQQGDIVSCHVCGGQYSIERMEPLRLKTLPPQGNHGQSPAKIY